ncbi:MAG: asparaginase domain-containing protein [Pseudomonadota bacterium]
MNIHILATGGTIDKVYFDANSEYHIGEPQVSNILESSNVTFEYSVTSLLKKDSLELTDDDRAAIRAHVESHASECIVITHGTDTMIQTAAALDGVANKTVVITGAMMPALFKDSDADFNIATATTAVQVLPHGVYIAMNGQLFDPKTSKKNLALQRYETL